MLFFSVRCGSLLSIDFSAVPLVKKTGAGNRVVDTELLFELSMLPSEGQSVKMLFDSSAVSHDEKPRIIFEPTFFGNEGCVNLSPLSRFIFSGDGIVEVRDGGNV